MKKRREFLRMYLHSGASYAPENGAFERRILLDAGYKNSAFYLKNFLFGRHLKTVTEPAPICCTYFL
jgi:hypothetical protein